MTPERWEKVREIFADAIALPEASRHTFVRKACGDDRELYDEVLSLLAVELADGELEPPRLDASSTHDLPPSPAGRRLGNYSLIEAIGKGANGTVFRARDEKLKRDVAVKVLETGLTTTPSQVHRFRSEPLRIARLKHPNIVRIHGADHEGATSWFAMELIDGHDLGRELDLQRRGAAELLLPKAGESEHVRSAAQLCVDIADALQVAHAAGIVHRDVKPQNILLDRASQAHLVDFGLARDEAMGNATLTGVVLGTVHYMSPEQTKVAGARIDGRTDVYSLGVVLYEMLTLQRPFDGGSQEEVWHRIRTSDVRPVRRLRASVPRDLEIIVATAMARDPKERYASAQELADDLRRFLSFESIEAQAPTLAKRTLQFVKRQGRWISGLVGAAAVAAVAIWLSGVRAEQRRVDAVAERAKATLTAIERATLPDLIRLRQDVASLQAMQSPSARAVGLRGQSRLAELESSWVRMQQELLEQGRAANDSHILLRSQRLLFRLALVFPDNPAYVERASDNLFAPRLTVRMAGPNGQLGEGSVYLRRLDPITGQPSPKKLLGPLPLAEMTTPEGYFRIRVETDGYGIRSFVRMLRPSVDGVMIEQTLQRGREHAEMVSIEPTTVFFDDPEVSKSGIQRTQLNVERFSIDRFEVSNAQYREYLKATGNSPPPYWSLIEAGSRQDRLPVTCISWYEARAYAEWRGLRLPTHAEWMLAARGPTRDRFPGGQATYAGNTGAGSDTNPRGNARFTEYLQLAVPVDELAGRPSAFGIYHTLGNVLEWSESLQPERLDGVLRPNWESRCVCGSDWSAARRRSTLATAFMTAGPGDDYAQHYRGFRCARTLQ